MNSLETALLFAFNWPGIALGVAVVFMVLGGIVGWVACFMSLYLKFKAAYA